VSAGADALGLVGPMPSGTGIVDLPTARTLAAMTPPPLASFLLTSATDPERLAAEVLAVGPAVLQIVDRVPAVVYHRLRAESPALRLVQVVHVAGFEETLDEALLGGTGRVHDWSVSRRIVEALAKPVILAGGLRPGNVAEAVRTVRPFAVDVCTGLRTDGRLDPAKLRAFVGAVAEADRGIAALAAS
jgi:phosphoribosylanthranilate isomerase